MRLLNSPIKVVERWASAELQIWPSRRSADYAEECSKLNSEYSIFAIDINSSGVFVRPKVDGRYRNPALAERANIYSNYLRSIMKLRRLPEVTILIDTNDEAANQADVPVFSFQRKISSSNPLMVDIDILSNEFYQSWNVLDNLPFNEKLDSAVFVGSTTGGGTITRERLIEPFPRLRAHRFFRGKPRVQFQLPAIVQAGDDAIVEALRMEGLGEPMVSWSDQLRHKLILSMDGNGAALSRPFIALSSNSVLVKYKSDCEAWYFRHLKDREHYLEVQHDEDVLTLVEGDLSRHKRVAYNGKIFAETYLTAETHQAYTIKIIEELFKRLH